MFAPHLAHVCDLQAVESLAAERAKLSSELLETQKQVEEQEAALQREAAMASSTASDLQEEMRRVQRELQESKKSVEELERTGVDGSRLGFRRRFTCG